MDAGFGGRLRLQRESKKVALATIAERTKIKMSLLEGLERDDLSHWPEGIFRRSYVRDYARAIGLEPEAVVREFMTVYPDPSEVAAAEAAIETQNHQGRFRRLVTSAVAAVPTILQRQQGSEPGPMALAVGNPQPPTGHQSGPNGHRVPTAEGPTRPKLSLGAVADLCTRMGRVTDKRDVPPLLEEAARILDAAGLVLWSWNARVNALAPLLAYGYSDARLAQMARVRTDADNAIAEAFRSATTCVVGNDGTTGALVVPLMAPGGCVGVLALELRYRDEQRETVRAVATILAAQLAAFLEPAPAAAAVSA